MSPGEHRAVFDERNLPIGSVYRTLGGFYRSVCFGLGSSGPFESEQAAEAEVRRDALAARKAGTRR